MTISSDATPDAPARRTNVFTRHWRGELPLWVSYWVVGIGATVAALAFVSAIDEAITRSPLSLATSFMLALALSWTVPLAVAVWQVVGTWRSATRNAAARRAAGRRPVWATIAKAMLIISVVSTLSQALRYGVPQFSEAYRIVALGDPDIPDFQIRVMRKNREAEYIGGIKSGAAEQLRKVLDRHPGITVLHLNSGGGRFGEAERMADLVRQRGLVTYVSASCESACTLVFAAGRERWIDPDAALGFHSPSFEGFDATTQAEGIREWRDTLVATGFEPAFVDRGIATPAEEMWYPTRQELKDGRVFTHVSNGSEFAVSGYGGTVLREHAELLGEDYPAYFELQQRSPALFDAAVDRLIAAYDAGSTPREIEVMTRTAIGPALVAHAPDADDDVLLGYSVVSTVLLDDVRGVSSGLCYLAATGGDFDVAGSRYVGGDVREVEWQVIERAIATAAPRPAVSDAALATAVERLEARLAETLDPRRRSLLAATSIRTHQQDDFCAAVIALGQAIDALPREDAVAILRTLTRSRRDGTDAGLLPAALQSHFLLQ
jgi:hypothetical protein